MSGISKFIYKTDLKFDLTNDTAIPEAVSKDYIFYGANGDRLVGTGSLSNGEKYKLGFTFKNNTALNLAYAFNSNFRNNFNEPFEIGDNVNAFRMFYAQMKNFNSPFKIGNNVIAGNMLYYIYNYNPIDKIVIGNNCNCRYMFSYCLFSLSNPNPLNMVFKGEGNFTSFIHDVGQGYTSGDFYFLKSLPPDNLYQFFTGTNPNKLKKNFYCEDLTNMYNTIFYGSTPFTWTPTTNGYYNSLYNIYLYNNIPKWVYNV